MSLERACTWIRTSDLSLRVLARHKAISVTCQPCRPSCLLQHACMPVIRSVHTTGQTCRATFIGCLPLFPSLRLFLCLSRSLSLHQYRSVCAYIFCLSIPILISYLLTDLRHGAQATLRSRLSRRTRTLSRRLMTAGLVSGALIRYDRDRDRDRDLRRM
jgi:hypothetical protein